MPKRVVVTYGRHGDNNRVYNKLSSFKIEHGVLRIAGENVATGSREALVIPLRELKSAVSTY